MLMIDIWQNYTFWPWWRD